jgi:DNA-binding CsgD family transcriptional regulator/PAS domain-containing protein
MMSGGERMKKERLRSEQIYQAMVDDEAFANLPSLLARSLGARSCVIHWRDAQHHAEILSHSQYFSDEHMLDYAENFVAHDDWTNRANEREFVNRVWNAEQLVPSADYQRSVFYNDWIRGMGDDTFHCMGTVMETERGLGIIGLHRGKAQATFDGDAIKGLNRNIVHLRRMLTVRARLIRDSARIRDLAALLDCNPAPMLAVNPRGRIVHANAAAQALLEAGHLIGDPGGQLGAAAPATDRELALAIARASDPASPSASLVIATAPGGHRIELTLAPVRDRGTGLVLVTVRDPDAQVRSALQPSGSGERLAPRELMVARLVGRGLRNREIAEQMGLTEGTVKVYLHNVFAKAGVTTRTELALLVGPQGTRPG